LAKIKKRAKSRTRVQKTISPVLIGIVAVAAIVLVAGLIILGNQSGGETDLIDLSQFPTKGDDNAPVTIIEFSDYG
jgi:protein-disulfide isomerase